MSENTAKVLEIGGNGGTFAGFSIALTIWINDVVMWLNGNYMAVIAVCTILTTLAGAYGTISRVRLLKEQKRRSEDK